MVCSTMRIAMPNEGSVVAERDGRNGHQAGRNKGRRTDEAAAKRLRGRMRLWAGIGTMVVAAVLALVVAMWAKGVFSDGYSSPEALAKAYIDAYIQGDTAALCNTITPDDKDQLEMRSKKSKGPDSCEGVMRNMLIAGTGQGRDVDPDSLHYTVETYANGRARVIVTRGGAPYDSVSAKQANHGRWYLDLDASTVYKPVPSEKSTEKSSESPSTKSPSTKKSSKDSDGDGVSDIWK